MRHRVILFDIDNTLVASGGAGRAAMEKAFTTITGVVPRYPKIRYAGRLDPQILRDLLVAAGLDATVELQARIFDLYARLLPAEMANGTGTLVLPGVRAVLERLSGRPHIHLGILTGNIARGAELKLAPFGLGDWFGFGAFGDDAPQRPELVPIALERWRSRMGKRAHCEPQDLYVVGDTIHDVGAARAHGARAVAVGTGVPYQDREELLALAPDFFFEDLTGCEPWLAEIL